MRISDWSSDVCSSDLMSLMGDAMAHAILPGVEVGFLTAGLSLSAMTLGGMATGLIVALLAGAIARVKLLREDASFVAIYLVSLGLGVLRVSLRGWNLDLKIGRANV